MFTYFAAKDIKFYYKTIVLKKLFTKIMVNIFSIRILQNMFFL